MIITKTPLRVSLLGGGTDIPPYSHNHGGLCVSMAIDKYIYVIVKKRHDNKIVVSYSQTETVGNVDALKHDLIRECLKHFRITSGIEISTIADITGRGSGLGSSGAVTVGVLHALARYLGILPTKQQLAMWATRIEMETLKRPIGYQDQITSAYGGFNEIVLENDGTFRVNSIPYNGIDKEFLLFFTGTTRSSTPILQKQKDRMTASLDFLHQIKGIAFTGSKHPTMIGELIGDYWKLKKKINPDATNGKITAMHKLAMGAGATSAKICGAGGGGFLLVHCPHHKQGVRLTLRDYQELEFEVDTLGTRVQLDDR